MAKENRKDSSGRGGFHVQFNLPGLVIFSVSLVIAAGVLAFLLLRPSVKTSSKPSDGPMAVQKSGADAPGADAEPDTEGIPPWGELLTQDTQMERPEEYTAMELEDVVAPRWTFSGLKPEQVRGLMATCGRVRKLTVPSSPRDLPSPTPTSSSRRTGS